MTNNTRVRLIECLVNALANLPTVAIDFKLSSFGFRTSQIFDGGIEYYLYSMLPTGTDSALEDLAMNLGIAIPSESPVSNVEGSHLWDPGTVRCFMSHVSSNKILAKQLKIELAQCGCSTFVAHEDIAPSSLWQQEIRTALATCHCLLSLVTPDFHASMWTDQEVGWALGRGIPVLPLRCGADPYGFFGEIHGIPVNPIKPNTAARLVFTALLKHRGLRDNLTDAAVRMFCASSSYKETHARILFIDLIDDISTSHREMLAAAAQTNSQIFGASGIKARLAEITGSLTQA